MRLIEATSCVITMYVPPCSACIRSISPQATPSARVEARVRLVEHHDLGLEDERPREAGSLAHAAGQLVGHPILDADQADILQPRHHDLADLALGQVCVLAQREGDVVVDGHRAEQRAVLEQDPELAAHLEELRHAHARDRLAVDEHVAAVGRHQPNQVVDQHALAGPEGRGSR